MIVLAIYTAFLFGIGFWQFKKISLNSYVISNKNASWLLVGGSIIASCVGGSATIGMVGLSLEVGFPAVWWLVSGACGLIILAVFLAKKVSTSGALTMPQMLEYYIGKKARVLSAIIITIAWASILAAQISAGGRIVEALCGVSFENSLFIAAFMIVGYAVLGGQASILRSDLIQTFIIYIAFILIFLWLIFSKGASFEGVEFELINESFGIDRISYFLIILGGSYVVCPMLFGRVLSAKDSTHAKFGVSFGVVGIVFGAIVIVLIALISKPFLDPNIAPDMALTNGIYSMLPPLLGLILLVALLSAIISSADSCLITASSVFCNDILKSSSLVVFRVFTLIFGVVGLILTFWGKSILGFLLIANDIYVSGVVAPVFIAMVLNAKVSEKFALAGMIVGGIFGVVAAISGVKIFSIVGVLAGAVITLLGGYKVAFAPNRG